MGLDAGTVKSRLDLDTTDFKHGFSEAHTHAEKEGAKIREVMEAIAEVATEIMGPAFAQVGQEIQSAFAGFSEGPLISSLNLAGIALGSLREAVMSVGEEFQAMALEAQKAGTSVEYFDRLAAVGGTVGVGIESVGTAFKILEQRAEEASQGNKKAQESFERLGISSTQLAKLLDDPAKLFSTVQQSIGGMTREMDRVSAAHDVLGKQGSNLIPILAMSHDQFEGLADQLDRLSGGMNDTTSQMGHDLALLQSYFTSAFEGIEREAAKPVLEYFSKHIDEIEPKVELLTTAIKDDLAGAWSVLEDAASALQPVLDPIEDDLEQVLPTFQALASVIGDLARLITDEMQPAIDDLGPAFGTLVELMSPALAGLEHMRDVLEEIDRLMLKQDELSGNNVGIKAQITGLKSEDDLMLPRIALTRAEKEKIKKLEDEANDAGGKFDFHSEFKDMDKINDLLRNKLQETGQLRDIERQVQELGPTAKLDKDQFRHFQEMARQTNRDVDKGDIHGALLNETDLLDQLKPFAPAVDHATDSMKQLSAATNDFVGVVNGVLSRFQGGSSFGSDGGVASVGGSAGAAAPGQVAGQTIQHITVHASFDHRESVNHLAAKLAPQFQAIRTRHQQDFAGAAMVAMAQASMSGEG